MTEQPNDPTPEWVPPYEFSEVQIGLVGARTMYLGLIEAEFTEDQACKIVAHCLMSTGSS